MEELSVVQLGIFIEIITDFIRKKLKPVVLKEPY